MPTERFKLVADVHLFVVREDRILLLLRYNTGYEDGKYSVVAGHLDGDETLSQAAAREAKEEAGIQIDPADLQLVHVMHHMSNSERMGFFFLADDWDGVPQNMEPDKCSELAWFQFDELPQMMVPYVSSAIRSYIRGESFSEFGWHGTWPAEPSQAQMLQGQIGSHL